MKAALRVSSLDVSSVWVVTQENGAVVARKAGDQRESVSIGQSSASILSDVSATADLRTGGRVHLPQTDYSGAAPQSLVPRSYVSRAPAFLYGLNHSSVTDTAHYSAPPDAGSLLVRTGDGLWGPQAATVTPYYHRHRVFTAAIPWADTQTPAFRYASFGCPPAGQAVAALNAFPHTASTCIYEVAVCLNNLQIGSGGGGNLITVTVRVHDTAVDTGLYEDEVYRQTDVASDEAVSANGYFADGRWNWKKAVTWAGAGQIAMNPGSAYRVSVKVALASPVAQTDTNTYATVQLKTLSSSFNLQTFGGSVPAPTATSTQISVTHSLTMSGGDNWAVLCRVYSASKAGLAAGDIYTKSGAGGTDLVVSSAFPMSGDGTVGSGPLVFSSLTPSTAYYVYVVAKGSSGAYSAVYTHAVTTASADTTPPTLALSTTAGSTPTSSPISVTATFSEPVTGFAEGDVVVTNGTVVAGSLAGSGAVYTFSVSGTANTQTTVSVGGGAATDAAGNGNIASSTLAFTYTTLYDPSTDAALYAWYDMSDASTAFSNSDGTVVQNTAGGTVLYVMDKKGSNHITQTTTSKAPTLDTATLNSKRSLRFTNANNTHLKTATTTAFWSQANKTVVVVARQATPFTYPTNTGSQLRGFILGAGGTINTGAIAWGSTSTTVVGFPSDPSPNETMCSNAEFFDGRAHVFAMSITGTSSFFTRFDGRAGTANGGAPKSATGGLYVGGDNLSPTRGLEGWVGEILFYSTAKTSAQLETIRQYLVNKWGTPA